MASHRPIHTHVIDKKARLQQGGWGGQSGYAMAALLVSLSVMGILMSMALPVWSQAAKREREAELIFRGEQYARAIELYQRQYVGAYPPDLDTLVEEGFLRRLYPDPMTDQGRGEFQPVYQSQLAELEGGPATADRPGELTSDDVVRPTDQEAEEPRPGGLSRPDRQEGGIAGVVSSSEEESLRIYNGRQQYNEWAFVYTPGATQPGATAGDAAPMFSPGTGQPTEVSRGQGRLGSSQR